MLLHLCGGMKERNLLEILVSHLEQRDIYFSAVMFIQDWAQVVNYFSACLEEARWFLIIKSISAILSLLLN